MKQIVTIIAIISLVAVGSISANDIPEPQLKSPETAVARSVVGMVLVPIVGAGLGHLYARNMTQFYIGTGLRTVAIGLMAVGIVQSLEHPDNGPDAALGIGFILHLGSNLYDIGTAGGAAKRYNRKHGLTRIKVRPTYLASPKAFGVQVTIGL